MPPRTRAAAAAGRAGAAAQPQQPTLGPLPHAVVLHIFALLPADARLRCVEVCRAWRATLADAAAWVALDLSPACGVARFSEALLRAAAARARGQLRSLDLCGRVEDVPPATVLEVVQANPGLLELRLLHTQPYVRLFSCAELEALLRAAPQLRVCDAEADCSLEEAQRMLTHAPPFGPLRLAQLCVQMYDSSVAETLALLRDVDACPTVLELELHGAPLYEAAALDAVVDCALTRGLRSLSCNDCSLSPASAPALARLLGSAALRHLHIWQTQFVHELLDEPSAALLAAALRANCTLQDFYLNAVDVWGDARAGVALLGALVAHPSLRELFLNENDPDDEDCAAVGAALGALVAADAPALRHLHLAFSDLFDEGLGPLVDALPRNTHLRTLDMEDCLMTEAFARDVLLPAVRANTSLRRLTADVAWEAAREAIALVAARERVAEDT
jgi:hypothetical protein